MAQLKLPENAYRKLKEGEEYKPIIPASENLPHITGYSLFWGLFFAALFSAAAASCFFIMEICFNSRKGYSSIVSLFVS